MASVAATSPRVLQRVGASGVLPVAVTGELPLPGVQRQTGRRIAAAERLQNTARAAREIADNAYEAGAENVWVIFDQPRECERGKHERKNAVSAIAFIDDGQGIRTTLSCEVQISFDRMQRVGRRSLGHAKECGLIVPMIMHVPGVCERRADHLHLALE